DYQPETGLVLYPPLVLMAKILQRLGIGAMSNAVGKALWRSVLHKQFAEVLVKSVICACP
ncbi:hypothetical protein HHI36_011544, partial [Cryptolaemus montrouzieri]